MRWNPLQPSNEHPSYHISFFAHRNVSLISRQLGPFVKSTATNQAQDCNIAAAVMSPCCSRQGAPESSECHAKNTCLNTLMTGINYICYYSNWVLVMHLPRASPPPPAYGKREERSEEQGDGERCPNSGKGGFVCTLATPMQ